MRSWVGSSKAGISLSSIKELQTEVHNHEAVLRSLLDSPNGSPNLSGNSLSQLVFDYQIFSDWLDQFLTYPDALSSPGAVQTLVDEVAAYQGWLNDFIEAVMFSSIAATSSDAPTPETTTNDDSIPTTSTDTSITTDAPLPETTTSNDSFPTASTDVSMSSDAPMSETITSDDGGPTSSVDSSFSSDSSSFTDFSSVPGSSSSSETASSTESAPEPTETGFPRQTSFNPAASDNIAVYFGQTDRTAEIPLSELCADKSIDIVILSFLTQFFGAGGHPTVNFGGSGAGVSTPQMKAAGATGLAEYKELKNNISECQARGKVVLLSLGGSMGNTIFGTDDATADRAGIAFADTLWKLFGPPTSEAQGMRPFQEVVLDGFDIDNETNLPKGYTAFTNRLRTLTASDSSKPYYLSASPQCPFPDASIPISTLRQLDFVWVQFYNNPQCNLGTAGFLQSLQNWSEQLAASPSVAAGKGRMSTKANKGTVRGRQVQGRGPKIFVGAFGWQPSDGETGFLEARRVPAMVTEVASLGLSNLGGWALWDGSEAVANGEYQRIVKQALKDRVGGRKGKLE